MPVSPKKVKDKGLNEKQALNELEKILFHSVEAYCVQ